MRNENRGGRRITNKEILSRRLTVLRRQERERKIEEAKRAAEEARRAAGQLQPGPTISVVGNAQSLFDNKYGNIIDDADIVIRFNSGVVVDPEAQGSKTTMVVWSNLEHSIRLAFGDVQFRCSRDFCEREQLTEKFKSRPSNGAIVLEHLRQTYKNSRVRIFGFDWKQTKTWYASDLNTEVHNFIAERKFCLKLIDHMGWELYR